MDTPECIASDEAMDFLYALPLTKFEFGRVVEFTECEARETSGGPHIR